MSMEKLPEEISRGSFIYRQINRKGRFAIYEQYLKKEHVACKAKNDPDGDVLIGFEVIVIRRQPAVKMFGKEYPSKELYPSPESFGKNGFTFNDFSDANRKFKSLLSLSDGRKRRLAS